jgi:type II secretory pathway component HofQ
MTGLLKVQDVAALLNTSKSSVYGYVSNGQLEAFVMPLVRESKATKRNKRSLRFAPEAVSSFLEQISNG